MVSKEKQNQLSAILLGEYSTGANWSITLTFSEKRFPYVTGESVRAQHTRLYSKTVDRVTDFCQRCLRAYRFVPEGKRSRFHYHIGGIIRNQQRCAKFLQHWGRNYGRVFITRSYGALPTCIYYRKERYHRELYPDSGEGELYNLPDEYAVITRSVYKGFQRFRERFKKSFNRKPEQQTKSKGDSRTLRQMYRVKRKKPPELYSVTLCEDCLKGHLDNK